MGEGQNIFILEGGVGLWRGNFSREGQIIFREMQNCITRICDALRDLYHLYDFAKLLQKHPWRSATFSKIAGQVSMGVFQVFKLYKWYQIAQSITIKKQLL